MAQTRIVKEFIKLVKINSTSKNESKIRPVLVALLKKIGLKTRVDAKGNIHAVLHGPAVHGPVILLNAHMDTVVPGDNVQPIIQSDRITSDGTTVLGADDKAGLAAILEALRLVKKQKLLFKEIKVIFTVEEEIGLQGAKELTYDDVKADYCFVLDADGDVGTIVIKAPSQEIMHIRVKGRAAHAGLNPEGGISAIKIAAEAIAKLKNGRIDHETTANIGIIAGGVATNIIAEDVYVKAEARSHNPAKLDRQVKLMQKAFVKAAARVGGSVHIDRARSYERVCVDKKAEIVQVAQKAAQVIGLKIEITSSGGGSDASIIYGYGVPTVALGIGMTNVHSTKEYITLDNLNKMPEYLLAIIKTAQKHGYDVA